MHAWDVPLFSLHRGDDELLIDGEGLDGYLLKKGSEGLGLPPIEFTKVSVPGGDGSIVTNIRYGDRDIFLPIHLTTGSYNDLTPMRRRLEALLDPKLGMVEIRLTHHEETISAFGYYSEGMEGKFGRSDIGYGWQNLGLKFDCPDPYWYGGEQNVTWFISQAAKPLVGGQGSFFPVVLQASVVAGEHEITVDGDAGATPRFSVAGPGEFVTITNKTTGQVFRYNAPLTGVLTVEGDDVAMSGTADEVVWRNIPPGDEAPTLVQGKNVITVQMSNASPESTVRMSWRNVYRSGH